MTPGMQFRLWLRSASRGQVGASAAVLAAVVLLLAASVSRGGSDTGTDALLGNVPDQVQSTTGGVGTGGGAVPGATSGTPRGTTPGTSLPGFTGTTGGSSTTGSTSTGSSTSTTGAPVSGSTGFSGTTGGGGSPSYDVSKATDRGVNNCSGVKACVKIGVLIAKIGGLDQSGFALNLRGDIQKVMEAFIADQNKRGGINGQSVMCAG